MKSRNLIKSFNYAAEGIIYVLRTQRNMKLHFLIAGIVLVLSLFLDLSRLEFIALLFAVTFVLVAELVNTAIEATIDVVTPTFDPLAMIAKDVAAGAVLISAINAVVVGYLVFFDRLSPFSVAVLLRVRKSPIHITFIGLFLVMLLAVVGKVWMGKGTPFRGGMPSVHSALAFSAFVAITFIAAQYLPAHFTSLVSTLALLMALLVSQTRIESGIHTFMEVGIGALLGIVVTVLVWQAYFAWGR